MGWQATQQVPVSPCGNLGFAEAGTRATACPVREKNNYRGVFPTMLRNLASFACAGLTAAALSLPTPVVAQSGNISLELNAARDVEGTCRLIFVATNNTGAAISELAYEVVMFDGEGFVDELLTFGFGELARDKTKVVSFIIGERNCTDISRVLVNNVASCTAADGSEPNCMGGLVTSSRADIEFGV